MIKHAGATSKYVNKRNILPRLPGKKTTKNGHYSCKRI